MENLNDKLKKEIENEITSEPAVNLEKNRKLFRRGLIFFAVIFLIAGSFLAGNKYGQQKSSGTGRSVPVSDAIIENKLPLIDKSVDFSLFWKVWDLLKDKHIDRDKLDTQKLIYGAINGMLKATGDPYTDFFNPEQTKAFSQDIEGSFEGIGAELGIKDNLLTIIAPLDGSPAQKSGLRSGDKILKVDDKIVADFTIDEAVSLIRGKKGTQVKLTILHEGDQETKDIIVIRDNIEIKNVKVEFKEEGIAYIKLIKFSDNIDKEFNNAISQVLSRGSRGIILDLRDNPGGLLDKSVIVASRMIPKGKVVVTEEDSSGKKESLYTSGGDKLSFIPTVVLINEGSASASEILAGALRDDQGITLIGKKSFGKGSVQQLINLPGESSVKITIAKWLTPRGDYIMEKGISPDIEIDLTLDDYNNKRDPQLDKAMEVIKDKLKQ
jgi:carboxyl-terminal processing protease